MGFRIPVFFLLFCAAIVAALGDYFSKRWAIGQGTRFLPTAYFLYMISTGIWFLVIKQEKILSRTAGIWITGGMLAAVATGVFVFKEQLSHANIIGIVLGILGIVLMSF